MHSYIYCIQTVADTVIQKLHMLCIFYFAKVLIKPLANHSTKFLPLCELKFIQWF